MTLMLFAFVILKNESLMFADLPDDTDVICVVILKNESLMFADVSDDADVICVVIIEK